MSRSWRDRIGYRAYRATRAAILAANRHDNAGRCTLDVGKHCPRHHRRCPDVCTGEATQVHHVKGKAHGDDPNWMIPTCKPCNLHVGEPTRNSPEPRKVSNW